MYQHCFLWSFLFCRVTKIIFEDWIIDNSFVFGFNWEMIFGGKLIELFIKFSTIKVIVLEAMNKFY